MTSPDALQLRVSEAATSCSGITRRLARLLSAGLEYGSLRIETPSGERIELTGRQPGPEACLQLRRWRSLSRLAMGGAPGFARAYVSGDWSSPDLVAFLTLAFRNYAARPGASRFHWPLLGRMRHALNRNTRLGSRRNIAAHYDLGNEFYRLWLDAGMNYSAALFSTPTQSLECAQQNKIDRALALLAPRHGDRVLEIGCGWGAFLERLLEGTECSALGVTLSSEQLAYARRRLARSVSTGRCDLHLQDYRDVSGTFERIASIEMLEAVGEAYWPTYFASVRRRLSAGGVAVLQVITIDEARFERYRRRPDFIQQHIFPGGMLPTRQIIAEQAMRAGLELVEQDSFAESYALTLACWRARFHFGWPKIARLGFDDRFKRMWDYYLSYCQVGFENGALDVGFYKFVLPRE